MGANQSEIAYTSAVVAAGYTSISETKDSIPKSSSLADVDDYVTSNTLIKTPFHANWHLNEGAFNSPVARMGTAFTYYPEQNKVYYAFGAKTNGECSSELVCYDINANRWSTVIQDLGRPRHHATGTRIGNDFYIFGGNTGNQYLSSLVKIDLVTKEVTEIQAHGEAPSPRINAIIGNYNGNIFIWGGAANNRVESNIHIYNPKTISWTTVNCDHEPRPMCGFCQLGNSIYIYGGCNGEGLLILDLQKCVFEVVDPKGSYPQTTLNFPSMIPVQSNYILCFGGTSEYRYSHIFAYDITRKWWFLYHIKPIMNDMHKGEISEIGLFKVPREHSMAAIYDQKNRQILYTFGSKLVSEVPFGVFEMGKSLAQCNLREDMLFML